MKWFFRFPYGDRSKSPSMRREWIEIYIWKYVEIFVFGSPSMRREWIEIPDQRKCYSWAVVSLHAEGVD